MNFNSSRFLKKFVNSWRSKYKNIPIYIVDNFSTTNERALIRNLSKKLNFTLIESDNSGYSAGLIKGIKKANLDFSRNLICAGNIDIICDEIKLPIKLKDNCVPWPSVIDFKSGREISNFHSNLGEVLSPLADYASIKNNFLIFLFYLIFMKIIKPFYKFSRPWSPYGCLFVLTPKMIQNLDMFFNSSIFLYCEEYYFGIGIIKMNLSKELIPIKITHIGNATTERYKNLKNYFKVWRKSWLTSRDIEIADLRRF